MGHLAHRFYAPGRAYRRPSWPSPKKENRLTLSPPTRVTASVGWGEAQVECEDKPSEISEGYKAAIALLRSLRQVGEEEAREQRETWELLEQALDEDRYH